MIDMICWSWFIIIVILMWPSWILMAWMAVVCYWVDPSPRLRTGNVAGLHRLLRRQHLRCCDPWSAGISQWMIENSSNSSSFWCSPPETSGASQNSDAQLESFVVSMTLDGGWSNFCFASSTARGLDQKLRHRVLSQRFTEAQRQSFERWMPGNPGSPASRRCGEATFLGSRNGGV